MNISIQFESLLCIFIYPPFALLEIVWSSDCVKALQRAVSKASYIIDEVASECHRELVGSVNFEYWGQMEAIEPLLQRHRVPHDITDTIWSFIVTYDAESHLLELLELYSAEKNLRRCV